MARLSGDKWRKRVERACVEEGDALYRRRGFPLWTLVGATVFMVVLLYGLASFSGYDHLVEKASAQGWSMLGPMAWLLFLAVRGPLLLVYLLLLRRYASSVWPQRMANWTAIVVTVAATVFLLFFSYGPVPETTVPWIIGTFFIFPSVAPLMTWLYEPLTHLSQRQDLVDTPFLRALSVANSRELQPLARVDGQTLTLRDCRGTGQPFTTPLSALRRVTIAPYASWYVANLEFADGRRRELIDLPSSPPARERVIDFLRRKLPPSIQLTVDNEPPLFGRGGL